MEWLGRAKVEFTHSPTPRVVKEKNGEETDLLKICEKTTPPCQLNPLLFNGHMQTMWTATKPHGPEIYYKRRLFQADNGSYQGSFAVDFVVPPFEGGDPDLLRRTAYYTDEEFAQLPSDDTKPMLVVLHGLSGGSHEVYLRHTIAPLIGKGWEICVGISRGCANSKITSGVLYNARATWDVRQIVKWMKKSFPNRPLFGLGFSLGANMLTNYCGEEGPNCMLKAAVVCSNPFDLEVSSAMLKTSFIGREVYLRYMASTMKALVGLHKTEIEKYTDIDLAALEKVTYLNEFDRVVQCPAWGYPTEHSYYRDSSSSDSVLAIRIPFLAVQALDDPIAVKAGLPFREFMQNPSTVMTTTSLGGHLCWFESGGGRWHAKPVCNFLNHMAFNVDLDSVKPLTDPATSGKDEAGTGFEPMRRKMGIRGM